MSDEYRHFGYVIASKRITVDEARVGFMCREDTHDVGDSGWRFYAGDEDDIYAATPENFTLNAITTIIGIDPSIEKYLDAPPKSAFERDGREWNFRSVPEYFGEE